MSLRIDNVCNCCKSMQITNFWGASKEAIDEELTALFTRKRLDRNYYAFLVVILNHLQHLKYRKVLKKHSFQLLRKSKGQQGYDKKPLYLYVRMNPVKEKTNVETPPINAANLDNPN